MASCQTNRWVANSAPYVKLTVTQKSSTATTVTLAWTLQYISATAARAGSRDYTVKIAGSTVKTGTYNINGVTGTKTIASGTKTINKTHSTQSIKFSVSFEFAITWSGVYAGTLSANGSISVAKKTSYTVSYNANGGSGVPSAQTKWYDETLTLSSTKPTRSGYTFVGWGTSTTDTTADWSAGGSYTANASDTLYAIWKKTITLSYDANGGSNAPSSQSATVYNATKSNKFTISTSKPTRTGYTFLGWSTSPTGSASYSAGGSVTLSSSKTLYAVWKLITYTVTYNANGGSNAPSSQTKTYGTDLKLTTSKPTRTNYKFKGWATSASGSVVYSAGGTYKNNASVTLYAVWEVAYIAPRITGVSVKRCDSSGNPQDDGTYALLKFKWATDEEVTAIKVERKLTTATAYTNSTTLSATGKSGSVSDVFGAGGISIESAYHYRITVTDSKGSSTYVTTVSGTAFAIDLKSGGKGVGIGEPAKENGLSVNMTSKFKKTMAFLNGVYVNGVTSDGTALSQFCPVSGKDNCVLGYGGYASEIGETGIYGNSVSIYSKGNVNINGDTRVGGLLASTGSLYMGNDLNYSTTHALYAPYADGEHHSIVNRYNDGLTSYFGWAGSSSYSTVTVLRGRTVKYSNSAGTTTLSDERLKKDFKSLEEWNDFFDSLKPCAFRMKNGNSGRYHMGFKAQQVEKALQDTGLSTKDFAGFVRMPYTPDEEDLEKCTIYEEAGINLGDDELGLVYSEFTALNTYQIQQLKKEVAELKKIVGLT